MIIIIFREFSVIYFDFFLYEEQYCLGYIGKNLMYAR